MEAQQSLSLAFVGDVMLGRLVNQHLKQESPEYVWGNTLPILKKADGLICNLECTVSDRGEPWSVTPKVFHFRSDAKNITALAKAGVTIASLANNHALDYGYGALEDTLTLLDSAEISHAGAGANLDAASTPAVASIKNQTIAMLAFTDNQPDWRAQMEIPGVLFVPIDPRDRRAQALFKTVAQLKAKSDVVVVSAHWGGNWGYDVSDEHIEFAHRLVLAGADVVFGHSPHVCRAVEIYRGRPILYSCGDFIDDYAVDALEPNDESFIFKVLFTDKVPTAVHLYPTLIYNFQARLADERGRVIAARMQQLLEQFETTAEWDKKEGRLVVSL
jgi:poly-gamma-glutamate capsule biosynthesis protein CapA/YwtB (metallophosphatase superfamily)